MSEQQYCAKCGGHIMTNHPTFGLIDVYAATIPSLRFIPRRTRQLCRDGPADARRPAQTEGFSRRIGWLRQNSSGVDSAMTQHARLSIGAVAAASSSALASSRNGAPAPGHQPTPFSHRPRENPAMRAFAFDCDCAECAPYGPSEPPRWFLLLLVLIAAGAPFARADDPQRYSVDISGTGSAQIDQTLRASAQLVRLADQGSRATLRAGAARAGKDIPRLRTTRWTVLAVTRTT